MHMLFMMLTGCTIITTRPVQEMANTGAALRAAREVQAETYASEYFRPANEWFFRAKQEYKLKEFFRAKQYLEHARVLAEKAELQAMLRGSNRSDKVGDDPFAEMPGEAHKEESPAPKVERYEYPEKQPVSLDEYEAQQKVQEAAPPKKESSKL